MPKRSPARKKKAPTTRLHDYVIPYVRDLGKLQTMLSDAGEFGVFGTDDKGQMVWLVEGRGVEPDMVVDNPPHATFMGGDAQLAAAIAHLKQLVKEKPVVQPDAPALPDKQFKK